MAGKSSGDSCIVGPVEPPTHSDELRLVNSQGPLSRDEATRLLDRGAELLDSGDFARGVPVLPTGHRLRRPGDHRRGAARRGPGPLPLRRRGRRGRDLGVDPRAARDAVDLPAWREIAAARVRDGDLQGAIAAYREAERRAPPEDKAEIATRLGWLAKETGNVRASRRYFARGRGGGPAVHDVRDHRDHGRRLADGALLERGRRDRPPRSRCTSRRSPTASSGGCGR